MTMSCFMSFFNVCVCTIVFFVFYFFMLTFRLSLSKFITMKNLRIRIKLCRLQDCCQFADLPDARIEGSFFESCIGNLVIYDSSLMQSVMQSGGGGKGGIFQFVFLIHLQPPNLSCHPQYQVSCKVSSFKSNKHYHCLKSNIWRSVPKTFWKLATLIVEGKLEKLLLM